MVEEECNEQAAQASVAIEKRVDRLGLHVGERGLEQQGEATGVVLEEKLQSERSSAGTGGSGSGSGTKARTVSPPMTGL